MGFSTELQKDQKTEPDPDYRDSQRELSVFGAVEPKLQARELSLGRG